jgi:hypothetical protein
VLPMKMPMNRAKATHPPALMPPSCSGGQEHAGDCRTTPGAAAAAALGSQQGRRAWMFVIDASELPRDSLGKEDSTCTSHRSSGTAARWGDLSLLLPAAAASSQVVCLA